MFSPCTSSFTEQPKGLKAETNPQETAGLSQMHRAGCCQGHLEVAWTPDGAQHHSLPTNHLHHEHSNQSHQFPPSPRKHKPRICHAQLCSSSTKAEPPGTENHLEVWFQARPGAWRSSSLTVVLVLLVGGGVTWLTVPAAPGGAPSFPSAGGPGAIDVVLAGRDGVGTAACPGQR